MIEAASGVVDLLLEAGEISLLAGSAKTNAIVFGSIGVVIIGAVIANKYMHDKPELHHQSHQHR